MFKVYIILNQRRIRSVTTKSINMYLEDKKKYTHITHKLLNINMYIFIDFAATKQIVCTLYVFCIENDFKRGFDVQTKIINMI